MGSITLADIMNPEGWSRRLEHDREISLKADIAAYGFQQEDRHHADKMYAMQRHDDAIRQAAYETSGTNLTIARERNNNDVYIARERNSHEMELQRAQHYGALDLQQRKHDNDMSLAAQQSHLEMMRQFSLLSTNVAKSALQREEDLNRSFANTMGNMLLARQQEESRERERQHEIEMMKLRADLDRRNFSHAEAVKFVSRMCEAYAAAGNEKINEEQVKEWVREFEEGQRFS